MADRLHVRKGTDAQRGAVTLEEAELGYATDTKQLWVGDGTTAGGIGVTVPPADSVTNAILANVATSTIKGRLTAATGDPEDLTATQARDIVERGTAPTVALTASRDAASTDAGKHLIADGAWTLTLTSSTGFTVGQSCYVRNRAGSAVNVTIAQGAGATVNVPAGQALTIPRYGLAEIYCAASNVYDVNGKLNAA